MISEMKDSGIEWIGTIPKDWQVKKIKYYGVLDSSGVDKKIREGENTYKSVHYTDVYRGSLTEIGNKDSYLLISTTSEKAERCLLKKGDVLFTNSSETPEDIGHSTVIKEDLENTLFGYHLMRFRPTTKFYLQFEKYLFGSMYMRNWFSYCSVGMTRYGINSSTFSNAMLIVPPLKKQEQIADYLDKRVSEIDNIIVQTTFSIEEYKKYKQSLITETVTKGLNPDVEMKDSGIEWIGSIPKHWKMVKIKTLFKEINERNHDDENATLLSLFTALGVKPRSEMEDKGNKASTVINYKLVKQGDIVVNKLLAWMGAISYSDYEGVTSPDYDVYRALPNANVIQDYYNSYFRFTNFKDDCYKYGRGIMMMRWRTYPEQFKNILVVNPPRQEQIDIVNYLNKKIIEIDSLISQKGKLLTDLELYKKSLIYECVTGKREVD